MKFEIDLNVRLPAPVVEWFERQNADAEIDEATRVPARVAETIAAAGGKDEILARRAALAESANPAKELPATVAEAAQTDAEVEKTAKPRGRPRKQPGGAPDYTLQGPRAGLQHPVFAKEDGAIEGASMVLANWLEHCGSQDSVDRMIEDPANAAVIGVFDAKTHKWFLSQVAAAKKKLAGEKVAVKDADGKTVANIPPNPITPTKTPPALPGAKVTYEMLGQLNMDLVSKFGEVKAKAMYMPAAEAIAGVKRLRDADPKFYPALYAATQDLLDSKETDYCRTNAKEWAEGILETHGPKGENPFD